MKKLLIVESPAKIKTISKFLGNDFKIMSTVGHIKDLPIKKLGVTLGDPIQLEYDTIENKAKVIAGICKEASTADEVFLAPDPDREGEIIAWHIGQEIEKVVKDKNKIHRISFNEITKEAIEKSIEDPHKVDLNKVRAQQARRVLDRWVGYEVSPILWQKITKGLSAGRVQSVALRMICDREDQIKNFKPEEYWSIGGTFNTDDDNQVVALLTHISSKKAKITNEKKVKEILSELKNTDFSIKSIEDKKRTKNPLPPFMTSTLQQAAVNQLGFSVKKTMTVAQQLYEGVSLQDPTNPVALITYMRTDSLRISDTAIKQARSVIPKQYGNEYLPARANTYERGKKSKAKTQDAHEAIRPINISISPAQIRPFVSDDILKLYDIIWRRFVSCQMTPALYAQRVVTIKGGKYTFGVTGSTLLFDGFLKVYKPEETEKDRKVIIPDGIRANEPVSLKKVDPKQHFTQPPAKYTEASLVKEMEQQGIGRPSTYSATLSTIQTRQYVIKEKKKFSPTELGYKVNNMLVENLPKIMDYKFTALMEEDLDKIAQGEMGRDDLLNEFYETFEKDLKQFQGTIGSKKTLQVTSISCPKCKDGKLAIRIGKNGEFVGCTEFPTCTFTSNFKKNSDGEIEIIANQGPKLLDEKCPECSRQLREIPGRFGPFTACSGYPECKYVHAVKAQFPCPSCKGDVVKKNWRGGVLWGCKNYPKCTFAVFGDIEETPCPECKSPFLTKKTYKAGSTILTCFNKKCSYKNEE